MTDLDRPATTEEIVAELERRAYERGKAEARADVDGLVAALQGLDAPFRWLQENYPKAFVEMPTPYFRALDKARALLAGDKAEASE